MARMVDLIRDGAAPASMIRRAAQGGLSLPASEAVEILVALAAHRELGEEAERTLENWNEASLAEVASNASTPAQVVQYLLQNLAHKPAVFGALCANPEVPLEDLESVVNRADEPTLQAMMRSERVRSSSRILALIAANPAAKPLLPQLEQWQSSALGNEADEVAAKFLASNAADVERDDAQPFELVVDSEGEEDPLENLLTRAKSGEPVAAPEEKEQLSLLQRIGRLRVGERIKLAVRGNREERMVLIRDRSKLVSLAVLESPKVNDAEMESFASMKNIQESVLRAISTKRSYMKNYGVLRALVNNPKTPLDVALPLLSHLLVKDLRSVSVNKNVNETIRKMSLKLFRMKTLRKKDD